MALSRLLAPLLLLSLLVVASANGAYNNYAQTQNEKVIDQSNPAQPGSSDVQKDEYVHQSGKGNEHFTFPSEDVKPAVPEGHDNFIPAQSSYGQKPKSDNHDYQSHDGINYIVIQGNILCKSGISSYTGIPGAIVKITCPGWYVNGYKYAPFSISSVANEHGYYCATYPVSNLPMSDWMQLVKGCEVIPVSSPLAICNLPNLAGHGPSGAYVSYSRIAGDKAYYNAGNVFFTPGSSHGYPKESNIPKETSLPVGGGY